MAQPGLYKHFKGGFYRVLFEGIYSTNGGGDGERITAYVSLADGKVFYRRTAEFEDLVDWHDGGEKRPRFDLQQVM